MAEKANGAGTANDNTLGPLDFGLYSSFLAYQSPLQTSWIAAAHGVPGGPREEGFTYVQQGCGPAFALAVLAASYPDAKFVGLESDMGQLERARKLASNAGLANLDIRPMPAADADLPQADILALSTILSWLGPDERAHTLTRAHRALNDNGIVCVQYSALPGNAAMDTLYALLRGTAETLDGDPVTRLAGAVQRTIDLARGGAVFFNAYPAAAQALQGIAQTHPSLGVHEVLHSRAQALYHSEVRNAMAAASLRYVGNGQLDLNYIELSVPLQTRPMVEAARTPELSELLQDFASNRQARADLYAKGPKLAAEDLSEALAPFRLTRFSVGDDTLARQQMSQQTGIDLTAQVYTELFRALEGHALTVGELVERPEMRKHARPRLLKAIQLATGLGLITLIRNGVSLVTGPLPEALAMNGVLNEGFLENNLDNPEGVAFAAPVTGMRVLLSMQERWLLHAVLGGDLGPVFDSLKARGLELKDKEGTPASKETFVNAVMSDVSNFRRQAAERLYRVGVLTAG